MINNNAVMQQSLIVLINHYLSLHLPKGDTYQLSYQMAIKSIMHDSVRQRQLQGMVNLEAACFNLGSPSPFLNIFEKLR